VLFYDAAMLADVHIHLLPDLFDPHDLRGGVAVIIDVLRASTTVITALQNGAAEVIPVGTVEEALEFDFFESEGNRLLGGERYGKLIEGFDLDNSPRNYTRERIAGRTIVFTTTNGTRALKYSSESEQIFVGAFVNRSALCNLLHTQTAPVHLVCAGTDSRLTSEDILFAGLIARDLLAGSPGAVDLETELAIQYAERHGDNPVAILRTLRESRGGRNLIDLGMDADVVYAALGDQTDVVPVFDHATGRIVPYRGPSGAASSRRESSSLVKTPDSTKPNSG
jgi:2-phosphosulfolactate phosphatase